ncbi:MAG: hypothetical protein H6737_27930 [Alphaproteobacteria bacterium]|nr:hypothetical protein [Alphaproteobacteria bacterium]
MTFVASTGDAPDAIDLELARLGGLDPAQTARVEAAARAELADEAAALGRAEALFAARARPLRTPSPRRYWAAGALAVAAAVALVALWPGSDGLRRMGGAADGLSVEVRPGTADDVLFVGVTPAADGWLTVATVQEDGHVSVLVSGETLAARAGAPVDVDGQIRLDGFAGREWLVVRRTDAPLQPGDAEQWMRGTLPDPATHRGSDTWVMEVRRP